MKTKVYLIPSEDSTYCGLIADHKKQVPDDAIYMVDEGEYPVRLIYRRHDLNMCSYFMGCKCEDRADLQRALDCLGECRHDIYELWDYDIDLNASDRLITLFDACYNRKDEIYCGIVRKIEAEYEEDFAQYGDNYPFDGAE